MKFPEKITFRIIDNNTKKPVPNIAVSLILYAHKKNDYYVGPKITNSDGLIDFERNDCIMEIKNSKEFYLMDYVSTLDECMPKVGIKIKPREEIDVAVENIRRSRDIYQKYWDCSEEYLKALVFTDNDKYIANTRDFPESELWQNKMLIVEVERKK